MTDKPAKIAPFDDPHHTFYYAGFGGAPSKCRLIRWESEAVIYIALSHIKWGGTSPTNMFEELATAVRATYYPESDPFDLEFFDHWPAQHSLTQREELIPVILNWSEEGKCYQEVERRRDLDAPPDFRRMVSDIVAKARAFARERGATEEESL
jgi:hypothetical protein